MSDKIVSLPSDGQIDIGHAVAGWIAYTVLILQGVALLAFLTMLVSKVMEGLIRLFGNVNFADSTHALDGGLFAAFGGLSQASRRKRRRAGKASTVQRDSMAGSVNTQMMLDRFSTHTTAGPISPDGLGNAGYFPGQTPAGWPVLSSPNTGYAPVDSAHEEVLQDDAAPRGFSVIRGGKATYKDPYRSAAGEAGSSISTDFAYQLRPMLSPTQSTRQGSNPSGRHTRTKSQTAIIESFPSSHSESPKSMYPPLAGSGENTPTWSPNATPTAESFFPRDFARPVGLQRMPPDGKSNPVESPTSESGKRSRPTSWFGLSSRKNTQADSDDEEELDDGYGSPVDPEPSRHGSWFSSLGLTSDKRTRSSVDEHRMDENALRKSNEVILNDAPAPRSFKVNRNKSSSTSRSVPLQSVPPSPTADAMPDLPQEALRPASQPPRSFVVRRANQSGRNSANSSQAASPVAVPMALPVVHDAKLEQATKSFVVNRQNRPGPAVSFAPTMNPNARRDIDR